VTPYEQLRPRVGTSLGTSGWFQITQDRLDRFTEATNDHQWIHLDAERAAAGPYGSTIAQGYLTMSLISRLAGEVALPVDRPADTGINYGLDRLRFPEPVLAGSRIRAHVTLAAVDEIPGGVHLIRHVEFEIEDRDKPALVADVVTRYLWDEPGGARS
jgi:acyl dehydratase